MEAKLQEHRKHASDLSLGSSNELIYAKASELVGKHSQGDAHLDFGSGRGAFLEIVSSDHGGRNYSGVDLMEKPESLNGEISWIQADLNGSLNVGDESFDSISALEIIEHLENPRHVFRELYRILKKQGTLIMSTPNNESWRSLISYIRRGHFVDFTDRSYPAHITPMNRKDLLRAAQEAGFQFVSWDFVGRGCVPGLTKFSWQGLSFGLLKGLRYSDNIFLVLKK